MITITCNSWEELKELAGKILESGGEPAAKAPKAKTQKAAAPAPAEAPVPAVVPAPVPTSAPAPAVAPVAQAPAPAPAPAPAKITKQDVQAKAIALMDAGKQAQLQALLAKYGVPALPSLDDGQLEAFMADLEAL